MSKTLQDVGKKYKCPLCNFEFDEYKAGCSNCPLHKNCNLICCPNCSYSFISANKKKKDKDK